MNISDVGLILKFAPDIEMVKFELKCLPKNVTHAGFKGNVLKYVGKGYDNPNRSEAAETGIWGNPENIKAVESDEFDFILMRASDVPNSWMIYHLRGES